MALKPWYNVAIPREDLREGRPLDASEFAVHLDQVRDGRAPAVYQKPERFFERTFLTENLTSLAAEVLRRLSGEKTEASPVFNMTTQFGGGKTHSLTLLYHLANNGKLAYGWFGVSKLLERAGISTVPEAKVAVFVGTEFDSISGRGGSDGTPLRRTPWGEVAFQLGDAEALATVSEHEAQMTAPAGDVIRRFLPDDRPCLILMDELMNYVSRSRKSGMAAQLYSFVHNLSEEARGRDNVVLAVSIPASEQLEVSPEDQADYARFKKLLDRLGKPVFMSAETEMSEIIRRRLFEWDERLVTPDGRVMLTRDAVQTCNEYGDWIVEHRTQLPSWFPIDNAREAFRATYPFHPTVLSVFERKWQGLPRFQQTRGVLRLLALWVADAYRAGFKGAHRDPMISLGSAPLENSLFRAAAFEQLGDNRLEGAVTTDITGKKESHALRLDAEAVETIRKARIHRKAATTIFFESNGGQMRAEATVPEIRLAVGDPGLDIGNIETALEALTGACYYLTVERNAYRFSLKENLNKRLSDRRASVQGPRVHERLKDAIREVFKNGTKIERVFFPERSIQVTDRPVLSLVVPSPDYTMEDDATVPLVDTMTRECGSSARTLKTALIWVVPESAGDMRDQMRTLLAWEDIEDEADEIRLDDTQKRQLAESIKRGRRDVTEAIWRAYKNVLMLGKDNKLKRVDLGLIHSSAADTLTNLIVTRLRQTDEIADGISPNTLIRNWSPAFTEWSTKAIRDAFFASPLLPRLLNADVIKETVARGVANGMLAYVGKAGDGSYLPFQYNTALNAAEIEISDDMFVITRETAEAYIERRRSAEPAATGGDGRERIYPPGEGHLVTPGVNNGAGAAWVPATDREVKSPAVGAVRLSWSGEVPAQKWMNFYTKVLSKFATGKGLKLRVSIEVQPDEGLSSHKVDDMKLALRELGLPDDIEISQKQTS
jgi:hypothetical protein